VSGGYRYGYNTQEKTDEIAGSGNHTTALYWEYDSRIGRRWNLDPVYNSDISRYSVNGNNPNYFRDPNGDFKTWFGAAVYKGFNGGEIKKAKIGDHKGEWYVKDKIESHQIISSKRTAIDEQTFDPIKISMNVSWGWTRTDGKKKVSNYKKFENANSALGFALSQKQYLIDAQVAKSNNVKISKLNKIHYQEFFGEVGSKFIRAGKFLSFAPVVTGVILTAKDIDENGLQNHHFADFAIETTLTTVGYFCPVAGVIAGGAYYLGDLGFQYFYNKSITEYYFD
jgi:hypothetical protein